MTININTKDEKIINFYGRTTGHISKTASLLLENTLPCYSISLEDVKNGSFQKSATEYKKINLEIGFGSGDFIFNSCIKNPDTLYLGVEVFLNGVASLLDKIDNFECNRANQSEKKLPNLFLYNGNVYHLLEFFHENFFDNLYILFPDPWPKKRHYKRRLINNDNLLLFSKILKPNANLRFVSDHYDYTQWTLEHFINSEHFSWDANKINDFSIPPEDHFETKYERKAIMEGREITYINCKNLK